MLNRTRRRKGRARQTRLEVLLNKLPELCSLDQQGYVFPAYALPMTRGARRDKATALDFTSYSARAKAGMAVGVTMLMEDFFGAVERAFIREANRIPSPSCLELRTAPELPLPVPKVHRIPERCRLPDRRRYVVERRDTRSGETPRYPR